MIDLYYDRPRTPDRLGLHWGRGHRVEVWWHPEGWPSGIIAWRATCGFVGSSTAQYPDKFEVLRDPAWRDQPLPSVESVPPNQWCRECLCDERCGVRTESSRDDREDEDQGDTEPAA